MKHQKKKYLNVQKNTLIQDSFCFKTSNEQVMITETLVRRRHLV